MNANELIKKANATEKESVLINHLWDALETYIEDGDDFSDVDVNDCAASLGWEKEVVKGVLGSLVKKDILTTWNTGTGYDVICFVGQEDFYMM